MLAKIPLHKYITDRKLLIIIGVGVAARLILMPVAAHPYDVYYWYLTTQDITNNGFSSLQSFPPLWYHYMLIPLSYFYNWLAGIFPTGSISMSTLPSILNFYPSYNIALIPGFLFNFVVKIPFLISDIVVTLLLYKTVQKFLKNRNLAEMAALMWFLNPFVIWISAGWGIWDTLPALFSLGAFYFLLEKRWVFSAVCLSLGVALKIYPLLFLIPIGFYFLKTKGEKHRYRSCAIFSLVFGLSTMLLFLPYIESAPTLFKELIVPSSAGSATVTNPTVNPLGFGLTYWSIYLLTRLTTIFLSLEIISFLTLLSATCVVIALIFVSWKIRRFNFKDDPISIAVAFLLTIFAFFLFFRYICEQWFIWAIPFLIILVVTSNVKKKYYWGVSFISLLYALINLPVPFFFLPLAQSIGGTLVQFAQFSLSCEPVRIALLILLGCLFSIFILLMLLDFKKQDLFTKR
jgi:uncharacterized membrane protein